MLIKSTLEQIISKDLAAIWTILTPDERRLVADNFHIHSFKKNQIIYAEKDTPQYLWCLLKGKVKLFKDGMGGRQQILRLYRPIQYFGYRAFFANEPYVSTAAAFEPSQLGAIPMQLVKDLINQNRDLAWFFIHELSKNLGGSDTKIVNLTQKHIRGRLAEAIILLVQADLYGTHNFGGSHFKQHLEHGVGSAQVGENECVHILSDELVEGELLVAQLLIEGILHLHFAVHQNFGVFSVQNIHSLVNFNRSVFGVGAEVAIRHHRHHGIVGEIFHGVVSQASDVDQFLG